MPTQGRWIAGRCSGPALRFAALKLARVRARAISSPLLNNGLEDARSALLNITGGPDLVLSEISEAADLVAQATAPEAIISFGAVIEPRLAHEAKVTLFVSGGRPHGQLQGGSGRRRSGHRHLSLLHSGPGCRGVPEHPTTMPPLSHRLLWTPEMNLFGSD